jgi:hypothetical protein
MLRMTPCARLRRVTFPAIACGLLFAVTACDSVYNRAQTGFSVQPADRLKMRIDEAHHAEQSASNATRILRDRVVTGGNSERLKTDVDRLELSALDLERCVAAVTDAAALDPQPQQFAAEIQRLQDRSKQFLKKTLTIRDSSTPPSAQQLDELMQLLGPH